MKKILTSLLLFAFALTSFAQKGEKKRLYKKHFYVDVSKDSGPVSIQVTNAVTTPEYIKFKLNVKNNTADYIIVKVDEILLMVDGKEYRNTEKELLIGPNDEDFRTIDIKGSEFRGEGFSLSMKGFSKVPANTTSADAENFKLPVSKNEIDAGPFHVVQIRNEKKTDLIAVKFNTMYNGSKVGIVNPGQASLLTPKGTEFANMGTRGQRKPFLLKKGQEDNFTLYWKDIPVSNGDMQFANVEIIWNDAFREAAEEPLTIPQIDVAFDPGVTEGKNK